MFLIFLFVQFCVYYFVLANSAAKCALPAPAQNFQIGCSVSEPIKVGISGSIIISKIIILY